MNNLLNIRVIQPKTLFSHATPIRQDITITNLTRAINLTIA